MPKIQAVALGPAKESGRLPWSSGTGCSHNTRAIESTFASTEFAIENVTRRANGEDPESIVPPV